MAMDMNIVNAAKDLNGPNGGFIDHTKAFDPLLKEAGRRTDIAARTQEAERRYQRGKKDAAEGRVRSMIDGMPSPDVSKVNDKLRPELQKELLALKQDYANNARILADADPSSEEYLNAKISMDSAMGGLNSINDGLVQDKEDNESYLADLDNGLISESVTDADKTILAYTRGGQYDSVYFENGKKNYVWTDPISGEQQVTNEEDIPNYSLENTEAGTAYINMWTAATGNAAKYGMPFDSATTEIKIAQLYKKIGRDGVLSMAYDDIGGTGDSFVENWEKNNPGSVVDWRDGANEEMLKKELSSYLSGVMKTSVDSSVSNYNTRQKTKGGPGNPSTPISALQLKIANSKKLIRTSLVSNDSMSPVMAYGTDPSYQAVPQMVDGVLKYTVQTLRIKGDLDSGDFISDANGNPVYYDADSSHLQQILKINK